ncbi:MAG TPA: response regulator transcription factor [Candidatus Dormibacteraeota bacterium]|nr:response regulator transcription factor [Candidatus Dormibacteraeota bacterium]
MSEARHDNRASSSAPTPRKPLRIGIVDDHPIFRAGLKRLLEREDGLSVEWETATARELLARFERHPVDVVLMDIHLGPGPGGFEATTALMARWPSLTVIVLSGSLDPLARQQAAAAGAAGFLAKDVTASALISSVRRFADGEATLARQPDDGQLVLSKRERQVLAEVRRGRTNREIAKALGVSTTTVNKHVQQILKKLRVTNRVQAASR